jgi:hypothetical protein
MTASDVTLPPRLKNWELAARTYNLLLLDPVSLEKGATAELLFDERELTFAETPDGRALVPHGMTFTSATGGEEYTDTNVLTTTYDFQHTFGIGGSLSVADAAGKAFSGTLSASFKDTRKNLEKNDTTETIARTLVRAYRLEFREPEAFRLNPELVRVLATLESGRSDAEFTAFFTRFGTHFSVRTVMGGIAYQRLAIKKTDLLRLLQREMDIKAEASATFKNVTVGGNGNVQNNVSDEFQRATATTRNRITYAGGTNSATFPDFVKTVADNPTSIDLDLRPIWSLLVPKIFPSLPNIDERRELLAKKLESYLSSNGTDLGRQRLVFGDVVRLAHAGYGRWLGLRTEGESYAFAGDLPGTRDDARFAWRLLSTDGTANGGPVDLDRPIALVNVATGQVLDAGGGRDDDYPRGGGLAGGRGTDPRADGARWRAHLVAGLERSTAVHGDLVRLETAVISGRTGKRGFLAAEPTDKRRAYSFMNADREGTIWQIVRIG